MWKTLALVPTRLAVAPQAARAASQFAAGQPVATAATPATQFNAAAKSDVPSVHKYNDRQDARSLPQAFTQKIEVRGVNPMLVRKKAKACGIVFYGIVLGLVLALPGCNNTESGPWPPIWSKAEQEALCRLPGHCARSTPMGNGGIE